MIEIYGEDPNMFDEANNKLIDAFISYTSGNFDGPENVDIRTELINTIRRYDTMRQRKQISLLLNYNPLKGDDEPI